ncbi:MAG: hypothetical protein ACE5JD_04405 [Candidatus Methylomirabilia bacterium]
MRAPSPASSRGDLKHLSFDSYEGMWANHADGGHKFHGIVDRVDFYGEGYDWTTTTWTSDKPSWARR